MADQEPVVVVVMGVSGSGKTTIGELLARRLGWEFADADDFHDDAAKAKMHAGVPLTDADRGPWLERIGQWMDEHLAAGVPAVVTCSALKRRYRDVLRRGPRVRLVHLDGDQELIAARIAARPGHFFPAALLESQFRALEPPEPDEHALPVSIAGTPDQVTTEIIEALALARS